MRQYDANAARRLTIVAAALFIVGYTTLFVFSPSDPTKGIQPDNGVLSFLGIGVALACYYAQRLPYRQWRSSHQRFVQSRWWAALPLAFVYQICAVVIAVLLFVLGSAAGIFPSGVA